MHVKCAYLLQGLHGLVMAHVHCCVVWCVPCIIAGVNLCNRASTACIEVNSDALDISDKDFFTAAYRSCAQVKCNDVFHLCTKLQKQYDALHPALVCSCVQRHIPSSLNLIRAISLLDQAAHLCTCEVA